MKTMLVRSVLSACIILGGTVTAYARSTVLPCTVEFPKTIKKVPELCIYHCGERFVGEVDTTGRRSCFNIPVEKGCSHFTLLITQELQFETEHNTVHYLKIDPQQPYKLYTMDLVRAPRRRAIGASSTPAQQDPDQWTIRPGRLAVEGRIPDDAIIVLLNPMFIDRVEGGDGISLPTIHIKENLLTLAGSEQELHNQAIELVLASLDYKPIHANTAVAVRQEGERIIIAPSSTM